MAGVSRPRGNRSVGVVLRTSDGGRIWHTALAGPVAGVALTFPTVADGWLLGQPIGSTCHVGTCPHVLYRTANGDVSWLPVWRAPQMAQTDFFLTVVLFPAPGRGYALGYRHACSGGVTCNTTVFVTADGSRRWQSLDIHSVRPTSLDFASSLVVWIGGFRCAAHLYRPVVLRMQDGGRTWRASALPKAPALSDSAASVWVTFAGPD